MGLLSYYREYSILGISPTLLALSTTYWKPHQTHRGLWTRGQRQSKQKENAEGFLPISPLHWLKTTKSCSREPPVLAFPDFSKPFTLHTDASNQGLGAILYQEQAGKMQVIAYESRTLTESEKNCYLHSGKVEFLALKWAVCEKFRDYLINSSCTVYTYNNPLTYVLSTAKLNA